MTDKKDKEDEDERWRELQIFAKHVKTREWALSPGLPDSKYDPDTGWTLDQFAMRFEPNLLQLYKDVMADSYGPADCRKKYHGYRNIEVSSELSGKLKTYLLDPRFRVEGYQTGAYEPMVIPRALLEGLHPIVEISELAERGVSEAPRSFEKVRVFDQSVKQKTAAGRKATYDWQAVERDLGRETPKLHTEAALVKWIRAHVKTMTGKQLAAGRPDDKTIRQAISKYKLRKFITTAD